MTPLSLKFIRKLSSLSHQRAPGDVEVFTVADGVAQHLRQVPTAVIAAVYAHGQDEALKVAPT